MDSGLLHQLLRAIELHDAEAISDCFAAGLDPGADFNGEPLLHELTSEYTRSPRFRDCVKAFVDNGLKYPDPVLLAVLLDEADTLDNLLQANPGSLQKKYTLRCAYTPFYEVSLLHICAEYNHVATARVLIKHGMDINIKAGKDKNGFGGQTPVFHTVNQNHNQSAGMLEYLLDQKADLHITIPGLIWGKGYEWETLIPSVNPISYAMMGLLPQMLRDERTIASTVSLLLKHAYGIVYIPANVPCAYLKR